MGTVTAFKSNEFVTLDQSKEMLDQYYVISLVGDHGEIHDLAETVGVFGKISFVDYETLKGFEGITEGCLLDPGCYPSWCIYQKDNIDALDIEIQYKNRPDVTIEL